MYVSAGCSGPVVGSVEDAYIHMAGRDHTGSSKCRRGRHAESTALTRPPAAAAVDSWRRGGSGSTGAGSRFFVSDEFNWMLT